MGSSSKPDAGAKKKRGSEPRTITVSGGGVPMTAGLAALICAAIEEQRERERHRP